LAWKTDRTVVAHGCRKTKKICGMEGENAVAYGRLLSPAHLIWGSVIYAPSPTLQGQFIKEKLDL